MTTDTWLRQAIDSLTNTKISSPRLDAQLLLAHVINKDKSWILAHGDDALTDTQVKDLNALLDRRMAGEPMAYIVGYKEFYGRHFVVTSDVLVPRPESEAFIELLHTMAMGNHQTLLDMGTGSGCLAISAALEFPNITIDAVDVSPMALSVARNNAKALDAKVRFFESDLCQNIDRPYDYILANLPYVPETLTVSPDVLAEPNIAVFSGQDGLDTMRDFMNQVTAHLVPGGLLLLEYLDDQDGAVRQLAQSAGLQHISRLGMVHTYAETPV